MAENVQCWGRAHRIGQRRSVHVAYLILHNTIEQHIQEVARGKCDGLRMTTAHLKQVLGYV